MKILIVTETIAGRGHEKAAQSIAKAIKQHDPKHQVKLVSLLSIFSKTLEKTLKKLYMYMITNYPALWQWIYQRESRFAFFFKGFISQALSLRLRTYIKEENPDLIIATHATGIGALAKLKVQGRYCLAAVFTDFQVNSFWVHKDIDYYFVAHEQFKERLIYSYGVESERIFVAGIPLDPIFSKYKNHPQKLTKHKKVNSFNILIMGGGLGLGGIKEIITSLNSIKGLPLKLAVVAGTNINLYYELLAMQEKLPLPLVIYQYVEDIHTLMENSDLLITKAGGLTISEALATSTPLLIYKPIPGQEQENVKFLMKTKAAIRVESLEYLPYWVEYLYFHPSLHQKLMAREQDIAKPESALYISEVLLENFAETSDFPRH